MSKFINVLGVDPSLRSFGMAHGRINIETLDLIIDRLELVKTEKGVKKKGVRTSRDDYERSRVLHAAFAEAQIGKVAVFAEMPIGSQSSAAMKSYGICVATIASHKIPLIQVTPEEVKVSTVGSKTASKRQMIDWAAVSNFYGADGWLYTKRNGENHLIDANEHLADACGAIVAGLKANEFQSTLSILRAAGAISG